MRPSNKNDWALHFEAVLPMVMPPLTLGGQAKVQLPSPHTEIARNGQQPSQGGKAMSRIFLVLALMVPAPLPAKTYSSHYHWRSIRSRILRNAAAKRQFERQTGHPHGWPGHVVGHVIPLACGGPDASWNMQWQTIADEKAKNKWDRRRCHK